MSLGLNELITLIWSGSLCRHLLLTLSILQGTATQFNSLWLGPNVCHFTVLPWLWLKCLVNYSMPVTLIVIIDIVIMKHWTYILFWYSDILGFWTTKLQCITKCFLCVCHLVWTDNLACINNCFLLWAYHWFWTESTIASITCLFLNREPALHQTVACCVYAIG